MARMFGNSHMQLISDAHREIERLTYFGWSRHDREWLWSCGISTPGPILTSYSRFNPPTF